MTIELRPRRLTRVCRAAAAAVVVVFATIAALLPMGSSGGKQFGPPDQALFLLTGLLLAGAVLSLTRPRVRADAQGLWVRNVVGDRFFAWSVVLGVHLPEGASWAQLELHDEQSVALLALQANDGQLAHQAVQQLQRQLAVAKETQS
jgi:hypothetical protein